MYAYILQGLSRSCYTDLEKSQYNCWQASCFRTWGLHRSRSTHDQTDLKYVDNFDFVSSLMFFPLSFLFPQNTMVSWQPFNQSEWAITDMLCVGFLKLGLGGRQWALSNYKLCFTGKVGGWMRWWRWWCSSSEQYNDPGSLLIDDPLTNMPPPTTTPLLQQGGTRAGADSRETVLTVVQETL